MSKPNSIPFLRGDVDMEAIAEEKVKASKEIHSIQDHSEVRTSCIVAVRNDEGNIEQYYTGLSAELRAQGLTYEIIFVDDGSADDTLSVLEDICSKDPHVRVVGFRSPFGESAAYDAGLQQARGTEVVFLTSRVRIDPSGVVRLLSLLQRGYDLVVGWRTRRADSHFNQFISRVFNIIVRYISKLPLHDVNSGALAAKRGVLESLPFYGNLNIFLPILADRKGYRVAEAPIVQLPGEFRQSKYVSEYIHRLLDILTVVFLTKYSKKPLHFLGFVGMALTAIGVVMNGYLFVYRIFEFGPIAGRPLLLLGALSLVIGLQMISIGLIGEMIIFTHAREIKDYSIEKIIVGGREFHYD